MRKRFYIMLVARNAEGELLKIPVPMHYLYVFVAGALIGMLTITGMLGSYTRMVVKTQHFNELRNDQETLKNNTLSLSRLPRRMSCRHSPSAPWRVKSLHCTVSSPIRRFKMTIQRPLRCNNFMRCGIRP